MIIKCEFLFRKNNVPVELQLCFGCSFLVGTFCEKSTFYRISIGLSILLESKLGCIQRVPLLGTILFDAFLVTRQHRFGFTVFFGIETFPEILCRQRVPSLVILIFCTTFYRISIGLSILLESKLGCIQRVPLLGTILFEAFLVTRQHRFGFTVFFGIETFPEILCRQRVPSLVILIFCTQRDDEKVQRIPIFCVFRHSETFQFFSILWNL